jgi:hypothetical protein
MKTRDLAIRPEDCSATRNYIYADHSRLSFRTTLVAKERIHGRCGAIRDSYNAPIAKNVPPNAVPAETSHRDTMAVATTIENQLQMARRDAVDKLEASKAVYLLEPTIPKRLVRRGLHPHDPSRPSLAIRVSQRACIYSSISAGSDTVRPTSSRNSAVWRFRNR